MRSATIIRRRPVLSGDQVVVFRAGAAQYPPIRRCSAPAHLLHKLVELPLFEGVFTSLCLTRKLLHIGLEGQPALPEEFLGQRHALTHQCVPNLFQRNLLNVFVGIAYFVFDIRRCIYSEKARAGYVLNRCEAERRVFTGVEHRLRVVLLASYAVAAVCRLVVDRAVASVARCVSVAPLPAGNARRPSGRNRLRRLL